MPFASHLKIHLKILGLAAALLAGPFAAAQTEIATPQPATTLPIAAAVEPLMAPTGHRQPDASDIPRDAESNTVARNEEEFDRKFGMCRRC
jgi:hypothetical protein